MIKSRPLSIYIHIPFCVSKCLYCDFLSFPLKNTESVDIEAYMSALIQEIEACKFKQGYVVNTVFFGGGTPSSVEVDCIIRVISALKTYWPFSKDAEITIETNPGTLDDAKLYAYRSAGINRLSIGLQSADNDELRLLGRIHTKEQFESNYWAARKAGFNNINIDIMSALPGQNINGLHNTIEYVLALRPEHISAYSLIIEEGTPFARQYSEKDLPDEDTDRAMYAMTKSMLIDAGYHQYEISNYAKTGYECNHNKVYWRRGIYLGFGLGAASFLNEVRWSNTSVMYEYLNGCSMLSDGAQKLKRYEEQNLSSRMQMEEFMFLGLRMIEGVNEQEFQQNFGISMEEQYGEAINRLMEQGLLQKNIRNQQSYLQLTERGIDISNYVFLHFI